MKTTYTILGGLLLTLLILIGIILDQTPQSVDVTPTPMESTPTIQADMATGDTLVPPQTFTPAPEQVVIAPHTVNGYTALIESYYIDVSHIIFQVRLTGEELDTSRKFDIARLGNTDIYDEHGNLRNSSGGIGPAADPELFQFTFVPVTLLKGDRFQGQFAFNLNAGAPDYNRILARFRFDVDLPIYPEVRFYPKQTVSANGIDMLLDSVTVTPVFTQVYLCFQPPSHAPWTLGNEATLEIEGQKAPLYLAGELFSSLTGSYAGAHSEPYWVPPVKTGTCHKIGFQIGTSSPTSLRLILPDLANLMPFLKNPTLELADLYPGLSLRQAYHTYLDEQGATHKGPWVFDVELTP